MWYLHKLMDGDLTNYIIVTRYDIDYNCEHVCLARSKSQNELYMHRQQIRGRVSPGAIITSKGEFSKAAEVAESEGLSVRRVQELVRRCRNWTRQWPPSWSDNGVHGPRIHRGRILHVGDPHYWEAYCFDDEILYDVEAALHRVRNINWRGPGGNYTKYDYEAYQRALKTGLDFPEGTGCVANGVYYGDEMTYDELINRKNDDFRSLVCGNMF